jgi:hypothetical protein
MATPTAAIDAALHPERAVGSLPLSAQVGPWASLGFNLRHGSPLRDSGSLDSRALAPRPLTAGWGGAITRNQRKKGPASFAAVRAGPF